MSYGAGLVVGEAIDIVVAGRCACMSMGAKSGN
jgi:hypothetical protein